MAVRRDKGQNFYLSLHSHFMRIFCAIGFSTAYIDYPENTEAFRAVYREIRGAADFPPLPNPPGSIVYPTVWFIRFE